MTELMYIIWNINDTKTKAYILIYQNDNGIYWSTVYLRTIKNSKFMSRPIEGFRLKSIKSVTKFNKVVS